MKKAAGIERIEKIEKIQQRFGALATRIFKDLILYVFLSGRVAFNTGDRNSDIDCIVVLKNRVYNDSEIKKKIKRFALGYLEIHKAFGYSPDLDFPGDVVSESQKEAALKGRGLTSKGRVEIFPTLTKEDWDKENVDYKIWLIELALNNDMFVAGDPDQFCRDSMRAMDTILKFLFLGKEKMQPKDVYNELVEGDELFLGSSSSYGKEFKEYVSGKIELSLTRLETSKHVFKDGDFYLVNLPMAQKWKGSVIKESSMPTSYLISWQELRDYMKLVNNQKT